MFYKQTVNDIKLVILSLDGGLLDLNRLRFNYLKKICKIHNQVLTKEEFERSLGNMYTMYDNFPISQDIVSDDLNELIERDLYEYAKLKPNSLMKEGTEELLQFFKQKNIKIAVISTHKIKRAIQYLQLTRLYNYVDFIIGGDSNNPPLPDPYLLSIILEQLNVTPEHALVVANYPNLLYAANQKLFNVIYLTDLCPAVNSISYRAFKVAKNNLEVINIFLFARYDSMEMYSPLLGMSSDMSIETLEQTYYKLLEEYKNDPQLVDLVRQTYHYFLGEILDKKPDSANSSLFEDEKVSNQQEPPDTKENTTAKIDNSSEDLVKHFEFSDEPEDVKSVNDKPIIGGDPKRVNELMDIINGTVKEETDHDEIPDSPIEKEETNISNHIINFFYTLIIVTIISFSGMLVFSAFEDFINRPGIVTGIIKKLIDLYVNIVSSIYAFIFNILHKILNFIPDYDNLISGNNFLSSLAIKLILFIIFNLIIVYIIKFVTNLLKESEEDNDPYSKN
ncbi:HAD hydrolase-like protein [Thomasclavelia saccharogumia]|uniref:HAD hydrolase-like protein n=1 Tax=Thomasclavelia saccharogumia TaxID=341225 RepID=UPI00047E0640|nr:HAD hydrolase-like protein [Thomasclavelia saccharogumia]